MKLKKFRIHHYKSIVDSGDCVLGPDFTILIGKNESGKTAILEALRDFDRDVPAIPETAVPINAIDPQPLVEMTFEVAPEELTAILEETQVQIDDFTRTFMLRQGICLTKSRRGEYHVKGDYFDEMFNDTPRSADVPGDYSQLQAKKKRLDELFQGFTIPELKIEREIEAMQSSLKTLRVFIRSRLNFIEDEEKREEIVELLQSMTRTLNTSGATAPEAPVRTSPRDKLTQAFVRRLPRFIFFSDFVDILPFEIAIDDVNNNQTVKDFARVANLDLNALIKADDLQKRINLLNRSSVVISGDFLSHWKQNKLEIIARPEGNKLIFGVKETDTFDFYKVEQRSKGFQWFLSFYLRLNRYKGENVVILIDEPGMDLHPVAQRDIIKVLTEKAAAGVEIIMSTHSPVLIDPQQLERIRCIVKEAPNGTTIQDDLEDVDQDTLLPIALALAAQHPVKIPTVSKPRIVIEDIEDIEDAVEEEVEEAEQEEAASAQEAQRAEIAPEDEDIEAIEELPPPVEESQVSKAHTQEEQLEENVNEKIEFEYQSSEPEKMEEPQKRSLFGLFRKK